MINLPVKLKKNHEIEDSFVTRCHVVKCNFYVPYNLLHRFFASEISPIGCFLMDKRNGFVLKIPAKGYIKGKTIEYAGKKQAIITDITLTGTGSLVAFRQLWQMLKHSYGKLDMYLLWKDGGCYSLRLNGKISTCDILSEYPKEIME